MGAQIKVELSLARAPSSSKGGSEPPTPYPDHAATPMPPIIGAPNGGVNNSGCFVCGSHDHWARECPDSDKMPQRNPPGSDRPSDARKPMWINGCVLKQSLISVSRQCSPSPSSLLEHPRFVILTLFSLFVLLPVTTFILTFSSPYLQTSHRVRVVSSMVLVSLSLAKQQFSLTFFL